MGIVAHGDGEADRHNVSGVGKVVGANDTAHQEIHDASGGDEIVATFTQVSILRGCARSRDSVSRVYKVQRVCTRMSAQHYKFWRQVSWQRHLNRTRQQHHDRDSRCRTVCRGLYSKPHMRALPRKFSLSDRGSNAACALALHLRMYPVPSIGWAIFH